MITRNFGDISKSSLIEEIQVLRNKIGESRYKIKISTGVVNYIDHDSRVIIDRIRYSSNQSMVSLKMEDLIIILRYLQNFQKCKEISSNVTNPDEVKNKIKNYLKIKKNIATKEN